MSQLIEFLLSAIPSWRLALFAGPPLLLWAFAIFYGAGFLNQRRRWRTGYTRKIVHVGVCLTAFILQSQFGFSALCLFGGCVSVVIAFLVWRGEGLLYEAVARETDAPKRTHYIIVPYLATLIGGLLANWWFGPVSVVGYLVTGLGDAVGEPVGVRFGRHTYRVPSLTKVKATRSLEGSAAVFVASLIAAGIGLTVLGSVPNPWLFAVVIAIGSCAIEAISPHGWDNATMQVLPSALAWWLPQLI